MNEELLNLVVECNFKICFVLDGGGCLDLDEGEMDDGVDYFNGDGFSRDMLIVISCVIVVGLFVVCG